MKGRSTGLLVADKSERQRRYARAMRWHPRLFDDENRIMRDVYDELKEFSLKEDDIPWIINLVEHPAYGLPSVNIIDGATDLWVHDHIHILLGRGLRPRDEAFVLGFTMGSTDTISAFQEWMYTFCAQRLYPRGYRFSDIDARVFRDAVRLGYVSDVKPLNAVDFHALREMTVKDVRAAVGLETDMLASYYRIEQRRYPKTTESARLI